MKKFKKRKATKYLTRQSSNFHCYVTKVNKKKKNDRKDCFLKTY